MFKVGDKVKHTTSSHYGIGVIVANADFELKGSHWVRWEKWYTTAEFPENL